MKVKRPVPDRVTISGHGPPYTALAPMYDRIMSHVDYESWAAYLLSLISRFAPRPRSILELGCGTGNITYLLSRRLKAKYLATDASDEMLAMAQQKMKADRGRLRFKRMDFQDIDLEDTFDVVVLAYDGINYLLETDEIAAVVESVSARLHPGGIFLFDQSTPANSINNLAYFDDAWDAADASYARKSEYDAARHLHITRFDIRIGDECVKEVHYQRAYDLQEMELTLKLSSLRVEGCFDAFTDESATGASERIQWVLTKPQPTD